MRSDEVTNLVSDLRKTIQTLKAEKEAEAARAAAEKEKQQTQHDAEIAQLRSELSELNEELRTRITEDEMKRIQRILVTLQVGFLALLLPPERRNPRRVHSHGGAPGAGRAGGFAGEDSALGDEQQLASLHV